MTKSSTPQYTVPAEWEPHEATWLAWPHNEETWPGEFPGKIEKIYCQIIEALQENEKVNVCVNGIEMQDHVLKILQKAGLGKHIYFHHFPTDDCWMRDNGPLFVRDENKKLAVTDWIFNKWGGKYPPWEADNKIPALVAAKLKLPLVPIDMVFESGSIDTNGKGDLITTESCLLNENRNPKMKKAEIESALKKNLGVTHIHWLGDGIVGDDTDGHVDDITRFVNATTIATVMETSKGDPNYPPLADNRERLKKLTTAGGKPFDIVELPMPDPLYYKGQRLPASYANFYIANRVVLVPIFKCKQDERAMKILHEVFPDHTIVGIDCRDLLYGQGGIHCMTMQQPKA